MGKTYKRNQQYKPKKNGKVFVKDQEPWKKHKQNDEYRDVRNKDYDSSYEQGS